MSDRRCFCRLSGFETNFWFNYDLEGFHMATKVLFRSLLLILTTLTTVFIFGCGGSSATLEGPPLAGARWGHTATLLSDGRVVIIGGQEKPSKALNTVEIYDPTSNTWSAGASSSKKRGDGHTATVMSDGKILVVGDDEYSSAEIYDPSSNEWSDGGTLNYPRVSASSTLLGDGRVLVAGGSDRSSLGRKLLDSAEIYDPSTNEWTVTDSMEQVHAGHGSAILNDGKVLVIGNFLNEVFDPSTDTWSPATKTLRERLRGFTTTVWNDGTVFITGGEFQQGTAWYGPTSNPIAHVETYDPSTGVWTANTPLTVSKQFHSGVKLDDNTFLIIGGADMESYDRGTNLWTPSGSLLNERMEKFSATLLNDGRVLIVGGKAEVDDRLTGINTVEIYDPSTASQ